MLLKNNVSCAVCACELHKDMQLLRQSRPTLKTIDFKNTKFSQQKTQTQLKTYFVNITHILERSFT